jgi:hypothetical protein
VTMMLPLIPLAIAIAIVVEIDRLLERGGGFVIVLPVVRIPPRPPPRRCSRRCLPLPRFRRIHARTMSNDRPPPTREASHRSLVFDVFDVSRQF